jgi:hypothetical protein
VKVGRTALDDEALRRIEQQNPDLEFDWPKILKGGGTPPVEPRPPFETRRPDRSARSGVRPQWRSAAPGQSQWGQTPDQAPQVPQKADQGPEQPPPPPEERGQTPVQAPAPAQTERGLTPFEGLPAEGTPAHERLGQDGVQRLRQRYADVRSRILERATDAQRRDELLATAERLNPDAWTTADEVTSALEQYEAVLASLRDVVGRKRRRRKRGSRRGDIGSAAPAASGPAAPAADSAEGEDDEDDDGEDEPGDSGSGDQGAPV